uniref:RNA-binding protein squid n=1 Tax=Ascaris suum TaxID=6253 RepID=F1KRR4_ASCSU
MDTQENQAHQENQKENGTVNGASGGEVAKDSGKGNEDKKIFVGGIAYDVTNEDLCNYFSQFGEVAQAQVKFDRNTGRSRGFAFVEFATGEACKAALGTREQTLKNKQIEVKPAKSRENKKVFVGGLPADFPEEDLRAHFAQYGKVEDIEWPFDKQTKARRNFAFIVFEEEESADRASSTPKQTFGSRECDVKKAVPQGKRFAGGRGAGAMRGGYGVGRGAGMPNGWFGQAGWGQMGALGAYGGGAAAGTWGDWYGNPTAASYYQGAGAAAYGAYGAGGYDAYGQSSQRGGNQQRYPQQQPQQY